MGPTLDVMAIFAPDSMIHCEIETSAPLGMLAKGFRRALTLVTALPMIFTTAMYGVPANREEICDPTPCHQVL